MSDQSKKALRNLSRTYGAKGFYCDPIMLRASIKEADLAEAVTLGLLIVRYGSRILPAAEAVARLGGDADHLTVTVPPNALAA